MQESTVNISTSPTAARQEAYDQLENGRRPSLARSSSGADSLDDDSANLSSSPFVASVTDETQSQSSNQENVSPSKDKRRSRIMSGHEISPLKMLQRSSTSDDAASPSEERSASSAPKSPRKSMSGMRRFPIKVGGVEGNGRSRPNSIPPPVREHAEDEEAAEEQDQTPPTTTVTEMSLEDAIAQNPGVKHAIEIFEDTLDSLGDDDDDLGPLDEDAPTVKGPMDPQTPQVNVDANGDAFGDDTMMSAFSDFSVIPNMTTFARLGGRTPSQMAQQARRGSNNTTNLLDFTDNLRYPGGRSSPTKAMTMADTKKTPQRQSIANLLDFEIPPMPTPRSVPSISTRELESLKSNFMSEISSLKATLSGKEAEAASLKTALMDAEKRAGESMEQLRDERTMRQQFSEEKDTWEKRGKEMETVLRQVKDEIMITQKERETLEAKLEESEGRREAAEFMAQDAESKMAAMRASKVNGDASPGGVKSPHGKSSQREIELAVEKVARELHTAYKSKHEAKVAALKKNYELRWDKKIRELESKIDELTRENEELRVGRDATLTKVELETTERREQAVKDSAEIKGLHAEVEKLEASLRSVQGDNAELRQQLECERVEKGELVTLAEELMQMQSTQSFIAQNGANNNGSNTGSSDDEQPSQKRTPVPRKSQPIVVEQTTPRRVPQRASAPVPNRGQLAHGSLARPATTTPKKATSMMTSPSVSSGIPGSNGKPKSRNSMIGRPGGAVGGLGMSGLRPPASSRIGGAGGPPSAHARTQSNVSGLARPGSGLARPGALMSSIQQMGNYRGRGE